MTFRDISCGSLGRLNKDNKRFINIIKTCCPYIIKYVREYAMQYYESSTISNKQITFYLLNRHEYDAIDISRIVKGVNNGTC